MGKKTKKTNPKGKRAKSPKCGLKKDKDSAKDTQEPQSNGRSTKGQFIKGNTAGSQGKRAESKHKEALTNAFNAAISLNDITAIAKAMVKKAKEGDTKAAQQVLDRCLGKVKEVREVEHGVSPDLKTVLEAINGGTQGKLPRNDQRDSSKTS